MTTTTTNADGRTRKSLAEQIDRLDAILDGLSDALEGAVAAAVKEAAGRAVREAVQAVLSQALTNPALRERALHIDSQPAPRTDSPSVPRPLARLAPWLGARARSCVQRCLARTLRSGWKGKRAGVNCRPDRRSRNWSSVTCPTFRTEGTYGPL